MSPLSTVPDGFSSAPTNPLHQRPSSPSHLNGDSVYNISAIVISVVRPCRTKANQIPYLGAKIKQNVTVAPANNRIWMEAAKRDLVHISGRSINVNMCN